MSIGSGQSKPKREKKSIFFIRAVFLVLTLILLVTVALFVMPYEKTSDILNHLVTDGKLESFTPTVYKFIQCPILSLFLIALILTILAQIYFKKTLWVIEKSKNNLKTFFADFFQGWLDLLSAIRKFCTPKTRLLLFGLMLLAFLMRIFLIHRPMQHDEAYSAVVFAFQPFIQVITDYHFPNNHVFHSILVHFSYLLFGPYEWAIRLPAFVASVLIAPLGYILAKRWHGTSIALISAISMAVFPSLIHYAVNARGYSLTALFTVLIFILGDYVRKKNNSGAWFLISLFGALGFFTLPIMAYPLAILYAWLGIIWLLNHYGNAYSKRSYLIFYFYSGLLTIFLGLVFYTPIFLNWGIKSLFANPYVAPMAQTLYLQTLKSRFSEFWTVLNLSAIPGFGFVLIIGFLFSILFHKSVSQEKTPVQLVSIIVLLILIFLQRPNIYARTWVFYYPLLLIWMAAGWYAFIHKITTHSKRRLGFRSFLLGLFIFILVINGFYYLGSELKKSEKLSGDVELATLFLKNQLSQEDIVIITASDDAAMWFYFEKHGLGQDFFIRDRSFEKGYVVVTWNDNQTVEQVIQERGPNINFFDMQTKEKIETIGRLDIYKIEVNEGMIEKFYGE